MIFNQNPFNKTSALFNANPKSPDTQAALDANNQQTSQSDSSVSKTLSDLSNQQQQNKAQDSNLDQSKMSLKDAKQEQPKEKFSITDKFKALAQQKMMNQISSSTQNQQDAETPNQQDNTPSPTPSKRAPKPNMQPPEFSKPDMKPPSSRVPKPKMNVKTNIPRVSIPKPRMR